MKTTDMPLTQIYIVFQLRTKKPITIDALHGCLAKSMVLLDALSCFSRSRRFSAFFLAPVFFLGIFPSFLAGRPDSLRGRGAGNGVKPAAAAAAPTREPQP